MKTFKLFFIIGVIMIPNIIGCDNNAKTSLVIELLRRHDAEYWFSDKKDIEFCHAIELRDTKKMETFLKEGFNINKQGNQGITFIIYSYLKFNKISYKFLLEHGANPNLTMKSEEKIEGDVSPMAFTYSVLSMAAEDAVDPIYLELGLKYGGNPNSVIDNVHILYNALNYNSFTNIQLLIEAGADVDGLYAKYDGGTPLYNSITDDRYDIAYYLLQKGANPAFNKDHIIFAINNFIGSKIKKENLTPEMRTQMEWREKVIKILTVKGYKFDEEAK
jgi:ankyrin repeat protein